jgi:hypothetical protein
MGTNVSEESITSIFKLQLGFLLVRILTMKMEVIGSTKTSVHIQTTRGYTPEDGNFQYGFYMCKTYTTFI